MLESGRLQQCCVLGQRALLALGGQQHIQGLQDRPARAGLVIVEQLLGDKQRSAFGQALIDFSQERVNLILAPVMDDAAQGEQVCLRQWIFEEVTGHDFDALGDRRGLDLRAGVRHDGGQIEHDGSQVRVARAGGHRQMAGRAAKVHEAAKAAQVEGRHDFR